MKNTKLQAMIMAGAMAASSFSAMSVFADETTSEAATEAVSAAEVDTEGKFVLEYPEDMQELGYTDPIVLDEVPERVVSLSAAPVLALYELGVNLVGIPNSMVVTWPEDLQESTCLQWRRYCGKDTGILRNPGLLYLCRSYRSIRVHRRTDKCTD